MEEIINNIATEINLPIEVVKIAYRSFFEFIRDKIGELPLKEDLSEEDFNALRCNFNIPALGKLYVTYDRYIGMKKRFQYINKLREEYERKEDKANVHKDCDNNG